VGCSSYAKLKKKKKRGSYTYVTSTSFEREYVRTRKRVCLWSFLLLLRTLSHYPTLPLSFLQIIGTTDKSTALLKSGYVALLNEQRQVWDKERAQLQQQIEELS